MWPFDRKSSKALLPNNSSLFNPDVSINGALDIRQWEAIIQRSFQRLPGAFKKLDGDGHTTERTPRALTGPTSSFAMDSDGEISQVSKAILNANRGILPAIQLAWYASQSFIGYQACAILAQHWLIDKLCTMPCDDAMRHGYKVVTEDDEKIDPKVLAFIRKRDKQMGIRQEAINLGRFNRIFGIRHALFIVESSDPNYYLKPFDIKNVKTGTYKGISQIDPYWITPELDLEGASNPASPFFYVPTWWRVNGIRIHRSHFVIITNGEVADTLKPTYYYGGPSVPQKVAERTYAAERTANEGPQLALTKRTTWMKVDITQALSQLEEFLRKMNFFAEMRDNYGVKIGGLDDEMQQFDTSLADFDSMTMNQFTLACAAGDSPAAKVLGESPKGGLGSEGGFDEGNYRQTLESIQELKMQPLIERHHQCLVASEVSSKFTLPADWTPSIEWNSVDMPDAKTQAEINEIKSRTGNNLTNGGAIDGIDERNRVKADKSSGYDALGDREPEPPDDDNDGGEGGESGKIESDKPAPGES